MGDRRFEEAEVAAIFEKAAESQQTGQHQLPSGEGMTLIELQAIGREVASHRKRQMEDVAARAAVIATLSPPRRIGS